MIFETPITEVDVVSEETEEVLNIYKIRPDDRYDINECIRRAKERYLVNRIERNQYNPKILLVYVLANAY